MLNMLKNDYIYLFRFSFLFGLITLSRLQSVSKKITPKNTHRVRISTRPTRNPKTVMSPQEGLRDTAHLL